MAETPKQTARRRHRRARERLEPGGSHVVLDVKPRSSGNLYLATLRLSHILKVVPLTNSDNLGKC